MALLHFSCLDKTGNYRECSYGSQHVDECLNALSALIGEGWQLTSVKLYLNSHSYIDLPIEALEGELIQESWKRHLKECEEILFNNSN